MNIFTGIYSGVTGYSQHKSSTAQAELSNTQKDIIKEEHNYRKSQRGKEEMVYDKNLTDRDEDRNIDKLGKLITLLKFLQESEVCPEAEDAVQQQIKKTTDVLNRNSQKKQVVNEIVDEIVIENVHNQTIRSVRLDISSKSMYYDHKTKKLIEEPKFLVNSSNQYIRFLELTNLIFLKSIRLVVDCAALPYRCIIK